MSYATPESAVEIANRFTYHPANTVARQNAHEGVRTACRELARYLDEHLPPSRHKALALTALEEAMHWANAAIACQDGNPVQPPPTEEQLQRPLRPGQPITLAEIQARARQRRAEKGEQQG
ncbi:hypothetical protein PBI_CHEETOBRO_5 [Mycobacterium phage Cheetobro]|uniref:hypothetical protein n=1 Tax=Mycobacterium phage Cheetobro TaxID=1506716 RepID=UPI0004E5C10E|nr:hypothetical protein PBI_CHEETOBRO_5 [Mycobacterium phage Cheetobro]AII27176.1 hypothetical protein PBI_CHEETOBRO_5 [Mycobacterium phage Cheetobro]ALA46277.1 hypothetical protein PBI_SLARP_5 [Mycobacterium phage Slarp]ASW31658.1 hypothetical protein SEA_CHANCELLOR_5 [Mycobacterium phage Chancellor]